MQIHYSLHKRETDDATLTLLHHAFTHLDHKGSFVRIIFIDFSSAFNTIQPHVLAHKLTQAGVIAKLVLWIVNFLVERRQKVHFQNSVSSSMTTSTGSLQGTVLSPFLFTLYTNDCRGTMKAPIIKYSDDSAIFDLSNDDNHYFTEVSKFTVWCEMNYLMLNVSKTKELVIDFRQKPSYLPDLIIKGGKVECVGQYKYMGTALDSKLKCDKNTALIQKKSQSRLYLLQKLTNLRLNLPVLFGRIETRPLHMLGGCRNSHHYRLCSPVGGHKLVCTELSALLWHMHKLEEVT